MFFLWFVLWVLAIITTIGMLLITSTIKIQIENFCFILPKNKFTNKNLKIILKLYLFGKIKILNINIDKTKMEKQKIKNEFSKIGSKLRKNKNEFDLNFFYFIKLLMENISLENLNLKIYLGTENAAMTAISVGIISGLISVLLGILETKNKYNNFLDSEKCSENKEFQVIPIYQGNNLLKIEFDGIFAIKVKKIK